MMSITEHVLRMERTFSATREQVFAAWTEPEMMGRWSAPAGLRIGDAESDVRVGGRYRAEMIERETGRRHVVVGRYLEIEPPARLRLTHSWLHEGEEPEDADARATTLTVELFDDGPRTRMVFTQTGFPSDESREGHREGWESAFGNLETLVAGEEVAR